MGFAANVGRVDRSARQILGGEEMLYKAGGVGPGVTVTGIFDAQYVLQARSGDDPGVCATAPAVFLQRADLPSDPDTDEPTVTIGGVLYRVDHPETAGMGSVVLVLRKVI